MEEDKRVPFVDMKMKGVAHVGWRSIDDRNANYGRRLVRTWEEMKQKFEISTG